MMVRDDKLTAEIRQAPSGPKVGAFFDLDQTLLDGFSATSFVRERLVQGRMAPREIAETFLAALSFALGRTGFSGLMSATTAAYRGLAESVLEEVGEEVFERHLEAQIYPEARELVKAHQEAGHTVAIISSATRYQAEPLARDMGIEHVLCTRLAVDDGVLTGEVEHPTCWGEGKAIAARELAAEYDLDLDDCFFYTDSHEDLPLLELVGRPRPLNPNRKLAQIGKERKWPIRRFKTRGRPSLGDVVRTGMTYASFIPSTWVGIAAGVVNGSLREGINVAGSVWSDVATSLAGIDLRVEGEENLWSSRPAVFVFNHQSILDTILMMKLIRQDVTGVGSRQIRQKPIVGPIFSAAGVVFVDRLDTEKAMAPAIEALREGRSLAIPPEGNRSHPARLGHFRPGAFRLAMQAGVPVVPVILRNVLEALPKDAAIMRPATIEAVVLPPIDTSGWSAETLEEEIEAIREHYVEILERD
jgi:putative phosphoserine phosphatase/1-acylglycerol-3-phosphate O-acyltransferase